MFQIKMPPKQRKTRHSSGSAFSSPCDLPESNQHYTNKNILSTILMQLELDPQSPVRDIAKRIEPLISQKWMEVNPCLSVIQTDSMINRIVKIYETAQKINAKKLTVKRKSFFMDSLDKVFDILICQCPFVDCDPSVCGPSPCDVPHIRCDCLRNFKMPVIKLAFIKDQREKTGLNGGKMVMEGVDKVLAKKQEDTKKKRDSVVLQSKEYTEEVDHNRNRRRKEERRFT